MTNQPQTPNYSGVAAGFSVFAATMMMLIGLFEVIAGLVALFNNSFYVVGEKWVFQFTTTTWGWIHLILGIVVFCAGVGLFSGAVWARTVGVLLSGIVALVSFAWLPWYPIWAIILITLCIFVIWALTVHGRDITEQGQDFLERDVTR